MNKYILVTEKKKYSKFNSFKRVKTAFLLNCFKKKDLLPSLTLRHLYFHTTKVISRWKKKIHLHDSN